MEKARFGRSRFWRTALFLLGVLALTSVAEPVYAGFGITPPYVENKRLTRGTVYEQKITLVRSDPTEDLQVTVTMNIPDVEEWFTIDKGTEFIMPAGQKQVPMVVRVTVPGDAEFRRYGGAIRIRTSPVNQGAVSGVSIALGAQIDVDIEVVDKILDFTIKKIRMADLEVGRTKWGLFFPGKIRFFMTVENTGNVAYGPTQVQFDIYDQDKVTVLETTHNTNDITRVPPFAIQEVVAELPTRLPPGGYRAKYSIYSGDAVVQQNEVNVSISNAGAVLGYVGYSFDGLSLEDKFKVGAVVSVPLLLFIILAWFMVRARRKHIRRRRTVAARTDDVGPRGGARQI